jgi:hypothetical protein
MNAAVPTPALLPKVRRARVYPRLDLELHRRLKEYCAQKGITVREGIEEAVARYLDGSSPDHEANVFGQLQKIALALEADRGEREQAQRETHLAVEVLSEAFGRFVRLWMFVHAAAFQRPVTQEAAEGLYRGFAAKVAGYFRGGHRLLHDLHDVADDPSRRVELSARRPNADARSEEGS